MMRLIATTLSIILSFSSVILTSQWAVAAVDAASGAEPASDAAILWTILETAHEEQDAAGFAATIEVLIAAAPAHADEIRARVAVLAKAAATEPAEPAKGLEELAENTAAKTPAEEPPLFDLGAWDGGIEAGFSTSSGNTREQAYAIGLEIKRVISQQWDHKLDADFDYARRAGLTSKEHYSGHYQVYYRGWQRSYVYMFLDGERDRFSGFDYRLTQSIGGGYKIIDSERQSWTIEGGPGLRETKVNNNGFSTEPIAVLNTEYHLAITPNVSIDLGANLFAGDDRTTLESKAALKARLNSALSARFSFKTKYDSSVPLGSRKTDTLTRATLVYDF